MPTFSTNGTVEEVSLSAVVIRADGTREDLGAIAYYHRNPLRRLWARVKRLGKVR